MAKKVGCSCQNKSIGKRMKRKRIGALSTKSVTQMLTQDLVPVAAGYIGGNMIFDKFADKIPVPPRWLKLGLGAVLGVTQKGMIARAGLGLATAGAVELISDSINGIGLLPPGQPSYYLNGLPGTGNGVPMEAIPVERVELA